MRPAEAAKALGVTRPTVLARALKGEFGTTEFGGLTFVSRRDVERAAAKRTAA